MRLWVPAALILLVATVALVLGGGWAWPLLVVGVVALVAAGLVGGEH